MSQSQAQAHAEIEVFSVINGEKSKGNKQNKRENPANPEEIVGYFPENTVEETRRAIDAAHDAFPQWAATPLN
jgi:delta 1-pyrroline-5-carboxylate dehydrogenase